MSNHLRNMAAGLACVCGLLVANGADAQVIWGGEVDRYFRPGAVTPYDGMNYQERYAYQTDMPYLYPFSGGVTAAQLHALDYYDRYDRAYRFGYPLPKERPYVAPAHRPRFGLGIFSRR